MPLKSLNKLYNKLSDRGNKVLYYGWMPLVLALGIHAWINAPTQEEMIRIQQEMMRGA